MSVRITLQSVTKSFHNRKSIFAPVQAEYTSGEVVAITGSNGTGKSTLLKIIAKTLQPTNGTCTWFENDSTVNEETYHSLMGFSAPYLNLYDEFTADEHCKLNCSLLGIPFQQSRADELFSAFGLTKRKVDVIKTFSSGMKQRVKLILALQHNPQVLLLDEPTTNMDTKGIDTLYTVLEEEKKRTPLIIFATNEQSDIDFSTSQLALQSTSI